MYLNPHSNSATEPGGPGPADRAHQGGQSVAALGTLAAQAVGTVAQQPAQGDQAITATSRGQQNAASNRIELAAVTSGSPGEPVVPDDIAVAQAASSAPPSRPTGPIETQRPARNPARNPAWDMTAISAVSTPMQRADVQTFTEMSIMASTPPLPIPVMTAAVAAGAPDAQMPAATFPLGEPPAAEPTAALVTEARDNPAPKPAVLPASPTTPPAPDVAKPTAMAVDIAVKAVPNAAPLVVTAEVAVAPAPQSASTISAQSAVAQSAATQTAAAQTAFPGDPLAVERTAQPATTAQNVLSAQDAPSAPDRDLPPSHRVSGEPAQADMQKKPPEQAKSAQADASVGPGRSVQDAVPELGDDPGAEPFAMMQGIERAGAIPGAERLAPTPAMQGDLPRGLGTHLAEAVSRFPDRPVELTLAPEELGRVRLTLSTTDAGLSMTILADRPETLDLLRRHIDQLAQDFRELGYADVAFSFGEKRGEAQDQTARQDQTDQARPDTAIAAAPSPTTSKPATRSAQGLDLRI